MANEMGDAEIEAIRKALPDASDDKIVCTYIAESPSGQPEMAILTTTRLAYIKGQHLTTMDLKDIESLMDNDQYEQKYNLHMQGPIYNRPTYNIEVKSRSGPRRMRIAIKPATEGEPFYQALEDAWKANGGKPKLEETKGKSS
ncbi:MAG: hypothetical protein IRY99_06255 [Isosphaeraceae bacterium]|nr:hypothetical protein [Isosphaeraceae bacterium]